MAVFRKKRRTEGVSDPVKLLITDHEKVERIFAEIEDADGPVMRQGLVSQLYAELSRHADIEEELLYPFVRSNVDGAAEMVDEAEQEHAEARDLLEKVSTLDPSAPAFMTTLKALKKAVNRHVREEESELFPKLEAAVDAPVLNRLRGEIEQARLAHSPSPALPDDRAVRGGRATASTRSTGAARATRAGSGSGASVWVQPHGGGDGRWQVRREFASRASRVFDTKGAAETFGRGVARREGVELIVAGRDGEIQKKQSYGNDPVRSRG